MDVVNINGTEYQRASYLAKKFRYTADYVGQLCRSGKVDAQLVGRSWYVNPESLTEHKKNHSKKKRSQTDRSNEITLENKPTIVKTRIAVEPVITKKVIKVARQEKNFSKFIDWKPVKYSTDETDLLPVVKEKVKPREVKINLADSTSVAITKKTRNTILTPDSLPSVPLRGKLKISSLNETYEDLDEHESLQMVSEHTNHKRHERKTKNPDLTQKSDSKPNNDLAGENMSFSPKSISDPVKASDSARRNDLIISGAWFLLSLSILLLLATLFFSWEQTVTATSHETNFRFSGLKFWE